MRRDLPARAGVALIVTTSAWQCDDGAAMTVHVLAGQGHVWFGTPDAREPLWASEAMWDFFTTQIND